MWKYRKNRNDVWIPYSNEINSLLEKEYSKKTSRIISADKTRSICFDTRTDHDKKTGIVYTITREEPNISRPYRTTPSRFPINTENSNERSTLYENS